MGRGGGEGCGGRAEAGDGGEVGGHEEWTSVPRTAWIGSHIPPHTHTHTPPLHTHTHITTSRLLLLPLWTDPSVIAPSVKRVCVSVMYAD